MQVLPGSELALEPQLLRRVKSGQALTLNRGCYLLIELPVYQQLPLYTEELLFELKAHGYRPILAHPERVKAFQVEISYLYRLVEKGVYLQLTLSSLTGLLGPAVQKTAWKLLSHGLVHFMATDAHCTGRRLSATDWAVQRLETARRWDRRNAAGPTPAGCYAMKSWSFQNRYRFTKAKAGFTCSRIESFLTESGV